MLTLNLDKPNLIDQAIYIHHMPVLDDNPQCRWDISLVSSPPLYPGFGPQNITVITSQESHHQHAFLIRIAETIFHMRLKPRHNYAIKCVYFLRFQRWYIRPNPCIIDGDVITTQIFTGFGKSVHRAVWKGLLALSGTFYKWFSHRGVHPSSGHIIQFPSFAQDSRISYRLQLVWPIFG